MCNYGRKKKNIFEFLPSLEEELKRSHEFVKKVNHIAKISKEDTLGYFNANETLETCIQNKEAIESRQLEADNLKTEKIAQLMRKIEETNIQYEENRVNNEKTIESINSEITKQSQIKETIFSRVKTQLTNNDGEISDEEVKQLLEVSLIIVLCLK